MKKILLIFMLAISGITLYAQGGGAGITKLSTETAPNFTPTNLQSHYAITPKGAIWYYQSSASTNPVRAAGWYKIVNEGGVVADDKYVTSATFNNGTLTIVQNGVSTNITVPIPTTSTTALSEYDTIEAAQADTNLATGTYWRASANNRMGVGQGTLYQKH